MIRRHSIDVHCVINPESEPWQHQHCGAYAGQHFHGFDDLQEDSHRLQSGDRSSRLGYRTAEVIHYRQYATRATQVLSVWGSTVYNDELFTDYMYVNRLED